MFPILCLPQMRPQVYNNMSVDLLRQCGRVIERDVLGGEELNCESGDVVAGVRHKGDVGGAIDCTAVTGRLDEV